MKKQLRCVCLVIAFVLCIAENDMKADVLSSNQGGGTVSTFTLSEPGPDYSKWEQIVPITNISSLTLYRTNRFTELASGMHVLKNGQWFPASPDIQILPDGSAAVATNTQHFVRFAANINNTGSVLISFPGSGETKSHIIGLSYYDPDSSNNVLIAELQDTVGQLVATNKILYTNVFSNLRADVLYTVTIQGVEQDIILKEQPPTASQFNLGSNTRLQVWTEFDEGIPEVRSRNTSKRTDLVNEQLNFGTMHMGESKAYELGEEGRIVPVAKHWESNQNRNYVVEEVLMDVINSQLQSLPPSTNRQSSLRNGNHYRTAMDVPSKQPREAHALAHIIAKVTEPIKKAHGFALDWPMYLNGNLSNMVFLSDTTYAITNTVYLSGQTVLEGGTVIKFSGGRLWINDSLVCKTEKFRPAILTASDDNSAGVTLPGSSGTPAAGQYGEYLVMFSSPPLLQYINCNYAGYCIDFDNNDGNPMIIRDCQFGNSGVAIQMGDGCTLQLHNSLFYNLDLVLQTGDSYTNFFDNVTFAQCNNFLCDQDVQDSVLVMTNCLLVDVTNMAYMGQNFGEIDTNYTAYTTGSSNVFQQSGAGFYYLATNTFRGVGSTNLDPQSLADLRQMTTYAPAYLTNRITNNTLLNPIAPRDTNSSVDLGYHYPAIDYMADCRVTNATLTLSNGVALGYYGYGVWLDSGGHLISQGTATTRNYLVHNRLIQEQPILLTNTIVNQAVLSNCQPIISYVGSGTNYPSCYFDFTTISVINGEYWVLGQGELTGAMSSFTMKDSEVFASGAWYVAYYTNLIPTLWFENCLWHRPGLIIGGTYGAFNLTNNLFVGDGGNNTTTSFYTTCTGVFPSFRFNNAFDGCYLYQDGTYGYNAYLNSTSLLMTAEPTSITTNISWVQGSLGYFYQPTNSPLINAGSVTADLLGLYHYTTQTNQLKETNSMVDIGYHYVALNTNGLPYDTTYSGIPDYLNDANGNGVFDTGDLGNWLYTDSAGNGVNNTWLAGWGLNPKINYTGNTNSAANYNYDAMGRLLKVSGTHGETIMVDAWGNAQTDTQ